MLNPAVTWLSALTLAFLASSSANLFLLVAICLATLCAIIWKCGTSRQPFPWLFVTMSLIVVLIRVAFRVVFASSAQTGPGWQLANLDLQLGPLGAMHFFGFLSVSSLLAGFTDGLRLAAIILSIGMASTLVSARTLLKYTPAALYEFSTALAIAVNLAPQLLKSLARVQRARKLRGRSSRVSMLASIVIPVLEDTIDQSLALAASMDSRGFGFLKPGGRRNIRNLLAVSFTLIAIGVYLLLTGLTMPAFLLFALSLISTFLVARAASKNSVRTNAHPLVWMPVDRFVLLLIAATVTLRILGWWPA